MIWGENPETSIYYGFPAHLSLSSGLFQVVFAFREKICSKERTHISPLLVSGKRGKNPSSSKSDDWKRGYHLSSQGGYEVVKLDGSILIPFSPIFFGTGFQLTQVRLTTPRQFLAPTFAWHLGFITQKMLNLFPPKMALSWSFCCKNYPGLTGLTFGWESLLN